MPKENQFCVIELDSLSWPVALRVPSARFRLFVAVDATGTSTEAISEFAEAALNNGMVYLCAWGPDCSRLHDIVDLVVVDDDLGKRLFVRPSEDDTIMTTWHESDTLTEALDFFVNCAFPTDGFETDSHYWVALCVNNLEWAAVIRQQLEDAEFSTNEE